MPDPNLDIQTIPDTDSVASFPYLNVLTDLIKKQMLMLGPNITLSQARKVVGLKVGDDGTALEINGDPQTILANLAQQFMALSGQIAQNTLEAVIAKYPGIKLPGEGEAKAS